MIVYEITYGDGECGHTLASFTIREKAEKYLEFFKEVDEDSWLGSIPEIEELEIDNQDRPYLIRSFRLDREGRTAFYNRYVEMTTKRYHDMLLFEPVSRMGTGHFHYATTTINKEDAVNEALAIWMVYIIEDRWKLIPFEIALAETEFDAQWMAECFDL